MEKITVTLGERSYPIIISSGLFSNFSVFSPLKTGEKAMLVTNETLAELYLDHILDLFHEVGVRADSVILPDGEQHKSWLELDIVYSALLRGFHGRDTTLLALGGGVVGDITGFAAASYQRGVRFIQIPTTLLSQIDSSIGGKTAINHPLAKNMIGAFYQPASVIIDLDCLKTLPSREFSSGLAEVIKYAIVLDGDFFYWLEDNMDALLALDRHALMHCICRCCQLKAKVVVTDEREKGFRTLLNFGHTFAHAIEGAMGYGNWLHGEAVSAGIVMASRVSERVGQFTHQETQRIIRLLLRAGLPVTGPSEIAAESYLPYMMRDKKMIKSDKIRLVLLNGIAKSKVSLEVPNDIVLGVIADCQKNPVFLEKLSHDNNYSLSELV